MSLKSGINYTEIISSCANNRVKKVIIGANRFEVEFYEKQPVVRSRVRQVAPESQPCLDFNQVKNDNDTDGYNVGSTEAYDMTEEIIQNMMLEDPLEYERMMKELSQND